MFSETFVCLFVCLSVSNITKKSYERIAMKFYGGVWGGKRNKQLNVGGDLDHNPALVDVCDLQVLGMTVCGYLVGKEHHQMTDSPNCESG